MVSLMSFAAVASPPGSMLRADVRVRVEPSLDAGLDARMRQLRRQCPGWQVAGDLRPDLVVVMFSQQEREAGVYYGADQGPRLESRWEPAVDAMIDQFRAGEFTAGVIDGLTTLTVAPATPDFSESPQFPVASDDSTGMPTTAILVLVLLLAGVAAVTVGRQWVGGGTGSSSNWWSSSRRYHSFGGFGSSFGSHSGSSSHSSGGGSKRW
jgi:hypothetical protein